MPLSPSQSPSLSVRIMLALQSNTTSNTYTNSIDRTVPLLHSSQPQVETNPSSPSLNQQQNSSQLIRINTSFHIRKRRNTRNPSETILALANAPFATHKTKDCSFLISSEAFFEKNPLIAATIKLSTQHKYMSAYETFRLSSPTEPTADLTIDQRLAVYIHACHHENPKAGMRQEMTNLLCMLLIMYPNLKNDLGLARRCISGWKHLTPSTSAVPLTKEMAYAFAWFFIMEQKVQAAVVLMTTYAACLRVSEALDLHWKDVAFPGDVRISSYEGEIAGINIWDAKTSRKTGRLQFVLVSDDECIKFLQTYKASNSHQAKVVTITYADYLENIKQACNYFGMSSTKFSTHSARVGKATQDCIQGVPVEQIAINGRWKSLNMLRYYLENGKAWLLNIPIAQASQDRLKSCAISMKNSIADEEIHQTIHAR